MTVRDPGEEAAPAPQGTPIVVGAVTIHPLIEIPRLLMEPQDFFVGLPPEPSPDGAWCRQEPHWDAAAGKAVLTIQAFLVKTPSQAILVDACVGNGKTRRLPEFDRRSSDWLSNFTRLGTRPDRIPTVVLTHLHPDHVGWATHEVHGTWVPTFSNARHLVDEAEYRFWTTSLDAAPMLSTGDYMSDSIAPLSDAGLLDLVAGDERLTQEVRLIRTPGHTPGSICVEIVSQGRRALIVGDLLHHVAQCHDPSINSCYCLAGDGAAQQRRALLEQVADTGTVLIPTHFPPPTGGHVVRAGERYRFEYLSR